MKNRRYIALVLGLMVPANAWAQNSTASQETEIAGGTLVLVTYFGFVAIMMGYMALLSFRQRKLDRDIVALEKRLDDLANLE